MFRVWITHACWDVVKKQVTIVHSALEACKSQEAIVIATEWKEFREIDWQTVYNDMTKPAFVFDGRLLVDADKLRQIGFKVRSHVGFSPDDIVADGFRAGQGYRPWRATLNTMISELLLFFVYFWTLDHRPRGQDALM